MRVPEAVRFPPVRSVQDGAVRVVRMGKFYPALRPYKLQPLLQRGVKTREQRCCHASRCEQYPVRHIYPRLSEYSMHMAYLRPGGQHHIREGVGVDQNVCRRPSSEGL